MSCRFSRSESRIKAPWAQQLQHRFQIKQRPALAKSVKTKTLQAAAALLGGPRKLRDALNAPSERVVSWLAGEEPPEDIFLKALDIVLESIDQHEKRFASIGKKGAPKGK